MGVVVVGIGVAGDVVVVVAGDGVEAAGDVLVVVAGFGGDGLADVVVAGTPGATKTAPMVQASSPLDVPVWSVSGQSALGMPGGASVGSGIAPVATLFSLGWSVCVGPPLLPSGPKSIEDDPPMLWLAGEKPQLPSSSTL